MNPGADRPHDPAALLRTALPDDAAPAPWPAPAVDELAAAFPELTLHELVGQGGMAAVYRATQTRLDRPVALKVMRRDLAAQPRFAERFLREAKALTSLANPHVLTIHDFGERAGWCYLVTEFVDGANLRELMRMGRLSPAEVLRIVPQICAGLYFAHTHGVVHRDIKPENVLVDRDGLVKLADFGLAKLAGEPGTSTFTRSGQVFGTPHYMAPEQWQGSACVDHRADIYSLGVVLYELLTGKLPVGTYAPASQQPGVPRGVDQVVQRSLQQEPERRYQSAREVQRELERQGSGAALAVRTGPRAGWLLAAAMLVFVVGGATIGWFHWRETWLVREKQWLRDVDQENGRLMTEIAAAMQKHQAWTGTIPLHLPAMPTGTLAEGVRTTIAVGSGTAVLFATMLLAAAARRRTRFAGSSRGQHVLAALIFAAPPVTAIGCGLAWYPALANAGDPYFAPWLVVVCSALGMALVFLVSWRASSRRQAGTPGPMAWWICAGIGLCTLAMLYCALLFVQAPRREPFRPQVAVPVLGEELVGLTREQVLDCLGPPVLITASSSAMAWNYSRLAGDGDDAVQFANGIVVGVLRGGRPSVPLLPGARARVFIGQTVSELVRELGPATGSTTGQLTTELVFADGTSATVSADGIVIGLSPR
jgi:tRNA A-37 threonylcarbamoyl transferase component Bud32